MSAIKEKTQEFVISRAFDCPRTEVWEAFSDGERMQRWWGPKDHTVEVSQMDFRTGGTYHYRLRSPEGKDIWGRFIYLEIHPYDKMVFVTSFSDEKGGLTRHPHMPHWPRELLTTLTFREKDGQTHFTMQWDPLNASGTELETFEKSHDLTNQGWNGTLDRLDRYLRSLPIVIERTYNAPVFKVWEAITDHKKMKDWYFDLKGFKPERGSKFEFLAGPDQKQYRHLCRVTEVIDDRKISYTWRYDGYDGESLVTFELYPDMDGTRIRLTHAGLETFPDTNPDLAKSNFIQGWTEIIGKSLKEFVEK